MRSSRQSSRPTAASEKRPPSGGTSRARARVMAHRSVPNHGLSRAPFTALRVVATSNERLAETSDASARAPSSDATLSHPPSASADRDADIADVSPRNTARREVPAAAHFLWRTVTHFPPPPCLHLA